MSKNAQITSLKAVLTGRVQGIGFRPFVYRLAKQFGVSGTVRNTGKGVEVVAQGRNAAQFLKRLRLTPPPLASISGFSVKRSRARGVTGFRIVQSGRTTPAGVDVPPDLAACAACRVEVESDNDRRSGYPFTNCTQCGPRYTIIKTLPYDRPGTTMCGFPMCPTCEREYNSPTDRRFHAQPNACHDCGPNLTLLGARGKVLSTRTRPCIEQAARALAQGKIVAVKSLGGFQLACDATNDASVRRLRRRKTRPAKPFALMCETISATRKYCHITRTEARLLTSPAAPVVLLRKRLGKQHLTLSTWPLSPAIAPGNDRFGVMLPYTPLHLLLFQSLRRLTGRPAVLVMTSANKKGSPIISECIGQSPPFIKTPAPKRLTEADRNELFGRLGGVFDLVLTHNRPIANPCDDSVVMARPELGRDTFVPVRVARGYTPVPIVLAPMFHVKHPVLAVGGDSRNAFCLAAGDKAYIGPHIGNVGTPEAERFFLRALDRLRSWTGIRPERIACDLHPDYASTRLAERLSAAGFPHLASGIRRSRRCPVPLFRVQHHFAHTVSVLTEHGITGPSLGIALDGTGHGTDGAVWGCEFLLVSPDLSWQRVAHLGYTNLPISSDELPDPKRLAAAYVAGTGRGQPSSSLGRLFDAVASITGICTTATFDGQPAMALEAAAMTPCARRGRAGVGKPSGELLDPRALVRLVSDALAQGAPPETAARFFHFALGRALARTALALCRHHRLKTVTLSGGSAQNSLLSGIVVSRLKRRGIKVLCNAKVPANDGGICLGQAIAAGR